MAKFNRRRLLLSGLTVGVAGTAIAQSVQAQTAQPSLDSANNQLTSDTIDAIFGTDGDSPGTNQIHTNQPSVSLTPATIAYDRAMSKVLILCSYLGLEQFERGVSDARYNGAIRELKSFSSELAKYTQVATFTVTLDATTTLLPNLRPLGNRIIQRVVNPRRVFIGFALASESNNIIVFRGTSNPKEWIANFQARQSNYIQSGIARGKVHTGFLRLYDQLADQVRRVANQLNPALPCFITGHSLGGALATLAAADLAQNNRTLKRQVQLYSYGAPRVGDLSFAKFFSAIAPNSYRVLNLADIVPMVPPSNLRGEEYSHIGQEWVFLDYAGGDVAASHATTLYQLAINNQIETNQLPSFPTACK
uniref:DUF2974 domain-containing protein n=1 Tax=Oscillatoriales cyanobacterium SpSt-402 TaxID=2282168 RepID=A0A832M516_9CYAN